MELEVINRKYQMLGYLADRGQIIDQLEVCSGLWDELLEAPYEKVWFRDLRIYLRRLRSTLSVVEPLLPLEGETWLQQLRLRSSQLGNIREYDVALQACGKYEAFVLEQGEFASGKGLLKQLPILQKLLEGERERKVQEWLLKTEPGCIAREMKECCQLILEPVELYIEDEAKANAFLQARLQLWGLKLYNKLQNLEKLKTSEQLHKLRIKVKRFRFAYEAYMNRAADEELLLALKELQDILGSLHDSDRDIELIEQLAANNADDLELQQETACFKIWRSLKIEQRISQLPAAQQRVLNAMKQVVVGVELL